MNILLTGGTGLLGKTLARLLSKEQHQIVAIVRKKTAANPFFETFEGDLTQIHTLQNLFSSHRFDAVLHCAANTDLRFCEQNPNQAYAINAQAAQNLCQLADPKTRFIHLSTDSVFDGVAGNYTEKSLTNPLNHYAKTKLEGEKLVLETNPNALVLRTNLYGTGSPSGQTLAEWAIQNLKQNNVISGFADVYFNPLNTTQLAQIINKLIEKPNIKGILNVGCKEFISKYDFVNLIAQQLNITQPNLNPTSIETANQYPKRPQNTTLNLDLMQTHNLTPPSIHAGIKALLMP